MTRDEAAAAVAAHKADMEAAVNEIEGARVRLAQAEPCGMRPSPEYARAMGDSVHGIARGVAALLRKDLAYSELTQRTLESREQVRQSLAQTLLTHAFRVAFILMAIGICALAAQMPSIVKVIQLLK